MNQTLLPTPYLAPEPKRPTSVIGLVRAHSRTAALFMAVALPVPVAAFSGMAIPLPTAVERIAAALVSGRTDIVSDVDSAAAEALQAAEAEQDYADRSLELVVSSVSAARAGGPIAGATGTAGLAAGDGEGLTVTLASFGDPTDVVLRATNGGRTESDPSGPAPGGNTNSGSNGGGSTGSGGSDSNGGGTGSNDQGSTRPVDPTPDGDDPDATDKADPPPHGDVDKDRGRDNADRPAADGGSGADDNGGSPTGPDGGGDNSGGADAADSNGTTQDGGSTQSSGSGHGQDTSGGSSGSSSSGESNGSGDTTGSGSTTSTAGTASSGSASASEYVSVEASTASAQTKSRKGKGKGKNKSRHVSWTSKGSKKSHHGKSDKADKPHKVHEPSESGPSSGGSNSSEPATKHDAESRERGDSVDSPGANVDAAHDEPVEPTSSESAPGHEDNATVSDVTPADLGEDNHVGDDQTIDTDVEPKSKHPGPRGKDKKDKNGKKGNGNSDTTNGRSGSSKGKGANPPSRHHKGH